jgi:hypothetical protein
MLYVVDNDHWCSFCFVLFYKPNGGFLPTLLPDARQTPASRGYIPQEEALEVPDFQGKQASQVIFTSSCVMIGKKNVKYAWAWHRCKGWPFWGTTRSREK